MIAWANHMIRVCRSTLFVDLSLDDAINTLIDKCPTDKKK